MRHLVPLLMLIAAQTGAAWAMGEHNVARPGGAYSTFEAQSAAACERLCSDDGLCMAWSFRDNLCELKATVPAAVAQPGAVSGVSLRAPASMRSWTPLTTTAPLVSEIQTGRPAAEDDVTAMLLGGPEEHTLRSRVRN